MARPRRRDARILTVAEGLAAPGKLAASAAGKGDAREQQPQALHGFRS